ncbi:MAG: asparagine--tRNA ligase [Candidatus Nanoarchaeia archaeon]|nr:asparagine--tRNA ligase [Candidatus Haiyanarchaeum thermophilum]MCW1302959.1 asparagine--tRNA ligase [Candidatus Haiyanarchaeum thermophilum]MCW1303637.1 asparagine--tRNA ligase [Candidatus Haiyanarchaeum thermophilum]MCW1306318.1 asparagine--tRNA ligase [Candidatus Haiyanarchaeum thermophilum]MCW1307172.1 asparagine--tRNA ligase [Candidatus Haiyanarchaeum thermophilum]
MYTSDVLKTAREGAEVSLFGWVYRKREFKDKIFIVLRDAKGIIQLVVKRGSKAFETAERVTIESSIRARGILHQDMRAPGGFEVIVDDLEIIHLAERFPISRDVSKAFLLDIRHLSIRSRRMSAIFRVRSKVMKFIREFFERNGFIEISPPMIVSGACEGGATLFEVKYFDDKAFLTQSWQLYAEALIFTIDKIYTIAPSFRAEKSRTIRHLTEYWHAEAEWAFATIDEIMRMEENLVYEICKRTLEECKDELEVLKVNLEKLEKLNKPFRRMTYDEALKILNEGGFKLQFGDDLGFKEEKFLAKDGPVFVYAYPRKIRAFYCKAYENNKELVKSVDLLVPRIGELSSGSERIDDEEELIERIREFGMNPKEYEWYLDLRRYGSIPHGGFGMGIERLLTWLLDLESVLDAIPFPRTPTRKYP